MRFRASLLLGLAVVAACGHPFDTSVQPDPIDASTESGATTTNDASPPSKEASVGGDDDDGGLDASGSDAGGDAANDGGVVNPWCTSFDESFVTPWYAATQGWEPPPSPPAFYTTADAPQWGTTQASTVGSPNVAFLTHNVVSGCRAHLRFSFRLTADPNTAPDIVIARLVSGSGQGLDFTRRMSGMLDVLYAGNTHTIGAANVNVWNTLDVDVPATGGPDNLPILLNGSAPSQPFKMTATATQITQLQLGIIMLGVASSGVTELIDLDDIEFNR